MIWCRTLLIDGIPVDGVRLTVGDDGRIRRREVGVAAETGDLVLGTVLPGMGNAHSHAFHRALRGRTHEDGGDFWQWRDAMYRVADRLSPERYRDVARGVFAEMLAAGWTAVGEFHYVHHRPDGRSYDPPHAMERALAQAASDVGIRLTLLDTAYLAGGIDRPLEPGQRRFGDGSAAGWLHRWHALRGMLAADFPAATLGAAIHSVRAVPAAAISEILAGLPAEVPLHIHVSEQPQENADTVARYGTSPIGLLAELGVLGPRVSVVHATHVSDEDQVRIAGSGATVVMCPTTEADLGDGIGPARELAGRGVPIALGSDQNAVIDPFLEMRFLEAGERLASGRRGRFTPAHLLAAASAQGYASLGMGSHALGVGDVADLVELSATSVRTIGSRPQQLVMTATASDVRTVLVGGRVVARDGQLVAGGSAGSWPADLLGPALEALEADA